MKSEGSLKKTTVTTPDLQKKVAYWIKIALSDLGSSRTLCEARHYRTSYFLFQQASEKANKAFALYANFATEEELSKIGHDQFKLYRRELVKKESELKTLVEAAEALPSTARDHEIMGLETMKSVQTSQLNMIRLIDGLRQKDLVNFSAVELNQLSKLLISLRSPNIRLSRNPPPEMKEIILRIADWAGNFQTPEAMNAKKKFEEWANDPVKLKEIYAVMIKTVKITADFSFIFFSLCCSAVLTIQHSSLTRYPAEGKDPLKIYTAKLPVIKKQFLFMDLLQEALKKLQKLNKPS
jgi:HEPN domain-containing protein